MAPPLRNPCLLAAILAGRCSLAQSRGVFCTCSLPRDSRIRTCARARFFGLRVRDEGRLLRVADYWASPWDVVPCSRRACTFSGISVRWKRSGRNENRPRGARRLAKSRFPIGRYKISGRPSFSSRLSCLAAKGRFRFSVELICSTSASANLNSNLTDHLSYRFHVYRDVTCFGTAISLRNLEEKVDSSPLFFFLSLFPPAYIPIYSYLRNVRQTWISTRF